MNERPPSNLLPLVAAGESAAMEACFDRYGPLVWSLARRWIADATEAEDVVQEVFLTLWRNADRFDETKASEKTFVTMIARRRLIDRQRRRARTSRYETSSDAFEEVAGDVEPDKLERGDEVSRAQQALAQLRPEQQRVLSLAIMKGMSHSEISAVTNTPLGTVKTHARRGLKRVRELLDVNEPDRKGVIS